MVIGVAGAYSSDSAEQRQKNLDALNDAAVRLLEKGHIPLIGVNAALPVVSKIKTPDHYKIIMDISLAVIERCEALLLISQSNGANREKELILSRGLPVFYTTDEVPDVINTIP